MITVEDLASALIAVFEGEKLVAYQDSGGVWTIGIGHTQGVTEGMAITHQQAIAFFAEDEVSLFAQVASKPILEAAALLSFGINCGRTALQRVLAGLDTIDNPVHTTDRHGNVQNGLVARRRLESALIAVSQMVTAASASS